MSDDFDIDELRLPADIVLPRRAVEPRKLAKRRTHFVQLPWMWIEALSGASGKTWQLAVQLLYLHWRGKGAPIKLANGMLEIDGIDRFAKWRALNELERRKIVTIERRHARSPLITLNVGSKNAAG